MTHPEPKTPVLDAEQRAWQYWFADGLSTLVTGVGCLSFALYLVGTRRHPIGATGIVAMLLLLGLYGAVILRQREIVEWLKTKISYPRTGYAAPPYFTEDTTMPIDFVALSLQGADAKRPQDIERVRKDRQRRALLVGGLAVGATVLSALIESSWICLVTGILQGATFWFVGRKDQRLFWLVLAGFPFIGLYMTIYPFPRKDRIGFYLLGAGVLFLLEGGVTLVRYLRRNPVVKAAEE